MVSKALLNRGAAAIGLLSWTGAAWAQQPDQLAPDPFWANPIIVTATRSARPVDLVSKSVSIVTEETINTRQPSDLLEVLSELPGVSVASDGIGGQLVVRGFSTQGFRAPLFINGDRFRGRNTLEYTLLDPSQIERIEVVRGPASSLYGTDSFGGIINVITKRAEGDVGGPFRLTNSSLSARYQSVNDYFGGRIQLAGTGGGFDVLLGANGRTANDYDSPAGRIPNSDFENYAFDARIGYTLAPGHRVEVIGLHSNVERGRAGGQFAAPGAGNPPGALQRQQRDVFNRLTSVSLGYQGELPEWGIESLEASFYRREIETHVNVVPDLRRPSVFVDAFVVGPTVYGGHLVGTIPWGPVITTLGFDGFHEDRPGSERSVRGGPRLQTDPDTSQLNLGAFMLHEWTPSDRLTLSGSLRFDYVRTSLDPAFIQDPFIADLFETAGDIENTPVTGGLGIIYRPLEFLHLVGNVSTSFRAPSVTEISAVGTGVSPILRIPNPDIEPEKGLTYEAGLRLLFPTFRANLVGFVGQYEDFIERDVRIIFNGEPAVQIQNIGEAEIRGVELDAQWLPAPDWRVSGNLTWLRGTDEQNEMPLSQIPALNGFASVRYEPAANHYYVEATTSWALDKERVDPATERPREGYAIFNVYAGLDLQEAISRDLPNATLRLALENVFDERYRLATTPEDIRFPVSPTNPLIEPGRNFKIALRVEY